MQFNQSEIDDLDRIMTPRVVRRIRRDLLNGDTVFGASLSLSQRVKCTFHVARLAVWSVQWQIMLNG